MKLMFWRHRYSLDLPWGKMDASFVVGAAGIEDIDHDDKTGAVVITHTDYVVVIQGEGFGYNRRDKKAKADKKPAATQGAA